MRPAPNSGTVATIPQPPTHAAQLYLLGGSSDSAVSTSTCFSPLTAIKNYIVPITSTLITFYIAFIYGCFGMMRAEKMTDNPVLSVIAQSWFFISSANFNFSPNIVFLQNFLSLLATMWNGTKGPMHRLMVIPALLWAIIATMPGTAASVDGLDSMHVLDGVMPNKKMFVGVGAAVFSMIFFVTRFTALVNFLHDTYFKFILYSKLAMPQYALYKQFRNDLLLAEKRINRNQTFDIASFYQALQDNNHSDSRTLRERVSYCFEDVLMGELVPVVSAIGAFLTFRMMAESGVRSSEHIPVLHKILDPIAGPIFNDFGALASSIFYYRTGSGFYDTMKKVLCELQDVFSRSSVKAKVLYSALGILLLAQGYTSGGGLAEERLSANYPGWLAWFNSWLVMAAAGLFVNTKAFGDFCLKIFAKVKAPDVGVCKALANYFFGVYADRMPVAPAGFTIEQMRKKLEEAIVLKGLDEQNNLPEFPQDAIKNSRQQWMRLFSSDTTAPVVVSTDPSSAPLLLQ